MSPFQLPVSIQSLSITAPRVVIYYPRVERMKSKLVQQTINDAITRRVYTLIQEQGYYKNPGNTEMTGQYEVKSNERGVLSITLSNYTYITHYAHGLTLMPSLTFNTQTGRMYQLQDLFKSGSDYVRKLSAIIDAQIKRRNIPLLQPFKGIRPDQDFYIADKALVVYFKLYEITPYYYGFPMFPISVYELEDILDENGPLGKMLSGE